MTTPSYELLVAMREVLGGHLDAIAELFKPGCHLTLLIRHPDEPSDHSIPFTTDDVDVVIAELEKRKRQGVVLPPEGTPTRRSNAS